MLDSSLKYMVALESLKIVGNSNVPCKYVSLNMRS